MSSAHEERKGKRRRSNQSKMLRNQVQEQAQLDRSVPRGGKARNYQQAGMLDGDGIFELKRFSYTVRAWCLGLDATGKKAMFRELDTGEETGVSVVDDLIVQTKVLERPRGLRQTAEEKKVVQASKRLQNGQKETEVKKPQKKKVVIKTKKQVRVEVKERMGQAVDEGYQ